MMAPVLVRLSPPCWVVPMVVLPARLMSPLNDAAVVLVLSSAPEVAVPVPLSVRGLALVTVLPLRSMAAPVLTTTLPVPSPAALPKMSEPC